MRISQNAHRHLFQEAQIHRRKPERQRLKPLRKLDLPVDISHLNRLIGLK
jgi:hypothetical protein